MVIGISVAGVYDVKLIIQNNRRKICVQSLTVRDLWLQIFLRKKSLCINPVKLSLESLTFVDCGHGEKSNIRTNI
jgi:hypothetical protein